MIEVKTQEQFKQEVLDSDQVVVVDFWASWCGPCKAMTPIFEQASKEFEQRVKFVKVNVDEAKDLPRLLQVRAIPTFAVFKNGSNVDVKVGAFSKTQFVELLSKHLN